MVHHTLNYNIINVPSMLETNSTPFLSLLVDRTLKNWFSLGLELKVSMVTLQWWLLKVRGSFDIQLMASDVNRENRCPSEPAIRKR